jgi:hypothetical protein
VAGYGNVVSPHVLRLLQCGDKHLQCGKYPVNSLSEKKLLQMEQLRGIFFVLLSRREIPYLV